MKSALKKTPIIIGLSLCCLIASCNVDQKKAPVNKENTSTQTIATPISKEFLVGSWLDRSPAALHFTLLKDGTARSDNMRTLLYTHWTLEGNTLSLRAKSIGNGSESTSDEVYTIKELTAHKMILVHGATELVFVKKGV